MSHNFIHWTPKCTNCLVKACCRDYRSLKERNEQMSFQEFPPRSLSMPKVEDGNYTEGRGSYSKALIECIANLLFDAVNALRKMEHPTKEVETENNISWVYLRILMQLSSLLQWVVNSTSWREGGEIHYFDKIEVKKMLKNLAGIL